LTVAGLDPSGGAGIVADVKTYAAFGCFATAVVTALTFQNTTGVFGSIAQTGDSVRRQMLPVIEDFQIASLKTGMLPTREAIQAVAQILRETGLPAPVVDPVVRSTSGFDLIDDEALRSLVNELFPIARVVTPNIPEAERITGMTIRDEEGMVHAARLIREMGARAVVIKGGHLRDIAQSGGVKSHESSRVEAADLLDDEGRVSWFRETWIESTSTHGTGCTLSAAIAACLALKYDLAESVAIAKRYVTDAIRYAPLLGHGRGPLNHSVAVRFPGKRPG
jgi:hydroxymethylpyrimidine/phosphomethylpyrimidine kinase